MPDRVLIIDDEREIANLTAMWMERAGYISATAYDGHSGLASIAENPPNLIFLDIRMPDLDGFEVNRFLKGTPGLSDIPVIFLSAHAQESTREEAVASGAARFLSKPYESRDLVGAARAALSALRARPSLCANVAPEGLKEETPTWNIQMDYSDRPKILIVDDDEQIVLLVRMYLERHGCTCVCAYSGAQGQCRFIEEDIDLVITDLRMSLGNGLGLIRAIRRRSEAPIIIMSGFTGQYADQMRALGEITLLTKPLNMAALLEKVRHYCDLIGKTLVPKEAPMLPPTILIADDDAGLIQLLKSALEPLEAEILEAQDALAALLLIHEAPPDLVILDVNMPSGNGLSVCEMLATDPSFTDMPIIIFTGEGNHARIRSTALGAHYVQKGVDSIPEVARLAGQIISDMRSEVTKSQLFIG